MTNNARYFISLIRCALDGSVPEALPEGVDIDELCSLAKSHMLEYAAYKSLSLLSLPDCESITRLRADAFAAATKQSVCDERFYAVSEALSGSGIYHMPLKGLVAKRLYPDSLIRSMSDMDLMYSGSGLSEVMRALGYEELPHTHGVKCFRKPPFVSFEFSDSLLRGGGDCPAYYGDFFRLASAGTGFLREMKPEDFYIYTVVHAARHYFQSGFGIRMLTDVFMFRRQNPDADYDYISRELAACSIDGFERNISALAECWFGNGVEDEKLKLMGNYVVNAGVYGSARFESERMIVQTGSHFTAFLRKAFPSPITMKSNYKSLEKAPILLPAFWIWHNIKRVARLKTVKNNAKTLACADEESVGKLAELYRISKE